MLSPRKPFLRVSVVGASLVIVGCAAPRALMAPASLPSHAESALPELPPPPPRWSDDKGRSRVDATLLELGQAEEQLDRSLPSVHEDQAGGEAKTLATAEPWNASGDGCSTACKALASMQRSAEHLCQMTGEDDGRCVEARGRVHGARARVRAACSACAGQP